MPLSPDKRQAARAGYFNEYYLKIDDDKFNDFEIMLSPKINMGSNDIVSLLVEKYNPTARVVESELTGKLR